MIWKKDGFQGERSVILPPALVGMEEDDELCQSLFITDIGYYPRAEHHHRARQQGADQYVLIYCVDGNGFFAVDGKRHEVEKNQFFVLPIGKPHEYGAAENADGYWTIYWLHFRGTCAHIFAEGAATPQSVDVTMNSRIGDRINIFEEIMSTLHFASGIDDLRYASSLLHYFLASMRYLSQFRRKSAPATGSKDGFDIVELAIHFISENIENRISINDVLRYVGYSQSHFSREFKKKTGQSPLAFINKMKVERACHLLISTTMKINMICYKVGIDDPLYFSRMFSKAVGMSPLEYRKKNSTRK
jgi:AraC-like DNA-binding protein